MTKKLSTIKCDCGELAKDHYQGVGQCLKNGCTWYHPNTRYILDKKVKNFLFSAQNISGRKKKPNQGPIEFRRQRVKDLYALCEKFLDENRESVKF